MATNVQKCTAKVILLGEVGAGKSSLFYRFKHKQFRGRGTESTDGVSSSVHSRGYDMCVRNIVLSPNRQVNMTIMDSVCHNDRGQSISFRFYHRVQVVMLVCSLDDEPSLLKLPQWIDEAKQHIKDQKTIYIVVGTKCDVPERERDVPPETLRAFGEYHGLSVYEVSAKTGEGVKELLKVIAQKVLDQPRVHTGGHKSASSSRKRENTPLLTESCDTDGFVTTKDVSRDCCSCVVL